LETFHRAFEPYKHFDPAGWTGVFRFLPVWVGLLVAALGIGMLLRGGGAPFRLIAGPLGLVIGQIWIGPLAARLGFASQQQQIALGASVMLCVLGFTVPASTVFFGFGIPVGLLAANLVGPNDWLLGFVPAFIVGGAFGVVLERPISILLASLTGGWLTLMGLMAALSPAIGELVEQLAGLWPAAVSVASCFALAGFGYQMFIRLPPEKAAQLKREKQLAKRSTTERKAVEQRWANYTKNSRDE
jgi:MFS family permease